MSLSGSGRFREGADLPRPAIEVPFYCGGVLGVKVPALRVGADGNDEIYQFVPQTAVGSSLQPARVPGNAPRALTWLIDAAEPSILSLQDFNSGGEPKESRAQLQFAAPLLPAASCVDQEDRCTQLAVLTADGVLHAIPVLWDGPLQRQMQRQLAPPGAVRSVLLRPVLERLGVPTTLLHVCNHICVGTDQGHILCLAATNPDPATAVELKVAVSALGAVIGSLWGRAPPQPVRHLASLNFGSSQFLCSFHDQAVFRLWDVQSQRMLYSAELLPPPQASAYRVARVLILGEPLDASSSMLVVYFEATAHGHPGFLATYELFMEDRDKVYKVQLSAGAQLQGGLHRLQDMAVHHVGPKHIEAWLLHDDAHGNRTLDCMPISFSDEAVPPSRNVSFVEDQLSRGMEKRPVDLGLQQEVWNVLQAAAVAAGPDGAATNVIADAFLDLLLTAGSPSRPALHAALTKQGCTVAEDDVMHTDLVALQQLLPGWVAHAAGTSAHGSVLQAWCDVLLEYCAEFRSRHLPLALVQHMTVDHSQVLMVMRGGGMLSTVRTAELAELVVAGLAPSQSRTLSAQGAEAISSLMLGTSFVGNAMGGRIVLRLLWACVRRGVDLETVLMPAMIRAITVGAPPSSSSASRSSHPVWRNSWRANCRSLPLMLANTCSFKSGEFASNLDALLDVLGYIHAFHSKPSAQPHGSPLRNLAAAAVTAAAQVAGAQVECLLLLQLLKSYVTWCQTLATWSITDEDSHLLSETVQPKLSSMLMAAAVAYWSAITPVVPPLEAAIDDPAAMVVALHIGSALGATNAPKRVRLSPAFDTYAASLLLASSYAEQARDFRRVVDLPLLSSDFSQWLLCAQRRMGRGEVAEADDDTTLHLNALPTFRALQLAPALFHGRQAAALAALLQLLGHPDDARLQFFLGCSKARAIREAKTEAERRRLEDDSSALFFSVAAIFNHPDYFATQLATLHAAVEQLHAETTQQALPNEGRAAAELQYYETLMGMYERIGCTSAASRFALAAAKHVAVALPGPSQQEARVQREGRLWANVFAFCLEGGEYEAAYAALLGNQVAELQVDCVHRLVNELSSRGKVELLCRLPFAHNSLLVRGGQPTWVPLLNEAVAALARRAANLELSVQPQPYKVLSDFHTSRGNFQAAAAAQLAYARRLAAERPGDAGAALEAEQALGAALSALSLVEGGQAWLEDPVSRGPSDGVTLPGPAAQEQDKGPSVQVLTVDDLRREYATARAHAAAAAVMPDGAAIRTSADDVFYQLMALGLHEDAFKLADAVYEGTKLDRAREKVVASLAAACVRLQRQAGAVSSLQSAALPAAGDAMEEDGEEEELPSHSTGRGSTPPPGSRAPRGWAAGGDSCSPAAGAAEMAWRHLRQHLERYEAQRRCGYSLRIVAVDAMLQTERQFCAPPWLLVPFLPSAPTPAAIDGHIAADAAGLLRVFMRHGRLEDAAALAERHVGAIMHSVPSISLAKTSAVCLPHSLLEQLVHRLQLQQLSGQQLADLVANERAAGLRQTDVIEQTYA